MKCFGHHTAVTIPPQITIFKWKMQNQHFKGCNLLLQNLTKVPAWQGMFDKNNTRITKRKIWTILLENTRFWNWLFCLFYTEIDYEWASASVQHTQPCRIWGNILNKCWFCIVRNRAMVLLRIKNKLFRGSTVNIAELLWWNYIYVLFLKSCCSLMPFLFIFIFLILFGSSGMCYIIAAEMLLVCFKWKINEGNIF